MRIKKYCKNCGQPIVEYSIYPNGYLHDRSLHVKDNRELTLSMYCLDFDKPYLYTVEFDIERYRDDKLKKLLNE